MGQERGEDYTCREFQGKTLVERERIVCYIFSLFRNYNSEAHFISSGAIFMLSYFRASGKTEISLFARGKKEKKNS